MSMNPEGPGTGRARSGSQERLPHAEDVLEGGTAESRSAYGVLENYPRPRGQLDTGMALGVLSIGLGAAALFGARPLGRMIGMPNQTMLLRMVGVRELVSGVGLLTQQRRAPWLWSRVVGDAMDLALIGAATNRMNPHRHRAMAALGSVAAITAVDVAASVRESSKQRTDTARVAELFVEHTVSVGKSPQECYAFWRDVSNVPKFSPMVQEVRVLDEKRSHWVVRGPGGARIEWDSEITTDRPGEKIAWHSTRGSEVMNAGVIRFDRAPGDRGTIVRVMMHYMPPAGRAAVAFSKLFRKDPESQVREDLRRFKALLETGEIPTTHGQPSGRRSLLGRVVSRARDNRISHIGASA